MSPLQRWFPSLDLGDRSRPRLFCFPAAGGNTAAFYRWRAAMADRLQVVPVELPGHRNRLAEAPHSCADTLLEDLLPALQQASDPPFALLGTSMGALLAFEAARSLQAAGRPPVHLVVACCAAPHGRRDDTVHRLPDAEFLRELHRMRATPPEILASPDLIELLLPAWRADFTLVATYARRNGVRLTIPITGVAAGRDPYAPVSEMRTWRAETDGDFRLMEIDAGHFFFLDGRSRILPDLVERLPFPEMKGSGAIS